MALLLPCAVVVSCGDRTDFGDSHDVTITFHISVAAPYDSLPTTRAANEGWDDYAPINPGTAYENALNPDDIHVKVCNASGTTIADVADIRLSRLSSTEYAVTGTWRDSADRLAEAKKVMVFANSNALTFQLADTRRYIPMWGVASLPQLIIGKRNDIGTVELLRAVAKVSVDLRGDMPGRGYSIASLTVNRYNTQGNTVPRGYQLVGSTGELRFATSLNPLVSTVDKLDFTKDSVAYLPEYDNTSTSATPSTVTVVLNRNNAYEGTYTLHFRNYDATGAPTGSPYDIMRNHIYSYTLHKSDGRIKITLHVREWNVRRHDEIIM